VPEKLNTSTDWRKSKLFPFEVSGGKPLFSVQYKLFASRTPKEAPVL
jgi:hypothetical protein